MSLFVAFVASLLSDYSAYLESRETVDLAADGVGYRQITLHLDDQELSSLAAELNQVIKPYLNQPAGPERKARLLATILMPAVDPHP